MFSDFGGGSGYQWRLFSGASDKLNIFLTGVSAIANFTPTGFLIGGLYADSATAKLHVVGNGALPTDFAVKVDNGVGTSLLKVNNAGQFGFGMQTTLATDVRISMTPKSLGSQAFILYNLDESTDRYSFGLTAGQDFFQNTTNCDYIWRVSTAEKMRLTFDGKLGIGTSTPAVQLHVIGDIVTTTGGGRFDNVGVGYSNWGLGANEISTLFGSTGSHLILQNTGGGNVGIGTATPTSALQVIGLPTYADNTAATGGGLTIGAMYIRSGHGLDIVV
jgi:hypothetical protein